MLASVLFVSKRPRHAVLVFLALVAPLAPHDPSSPRPPRLRHGVGSRRAGDLALVPASPPDALPWGACSNGATRTARRPADPSYRSEVALASPSSRFLELRIEGAPGVRSEAGGASWRRAK